MYGNNQEVRKIHNEEHQILHPKLNIFGVIKTVHGLDGAATVVDMISEQYSGENMEGSSQCIRSGGLWVQFQTHSL
jgi:hypothetical protein